MFNKISSSILLLVFLFFNINANDKNSIQITGGVISPRNSNSGFIGALQYNYKLSEKISIYAYSGFSSWKKNKVVFQSEYPNIQSRSFINSYSEDNHKLIPLYFGSKINLSKNKIFDAYFLAEVGYSYLTYDNYQNDKIFNEAKDVIIDYRVNENSKTEMEENLFGVGIGTSLEREIVSDIRLSLMLKLNSFINDNYNGFLSGRGTYYQVTAGINYSI